MQHTLLPATERRALRREYRVRVLIVLCFMASLAGLIGIGSLFPTFMRASLEEQSTLSVIASLKKVKDDSGMTKIEGELADDEALLAALEKHIGTALLSSVVEDAISARGSLQLTSFSLNRASTSTVVVVLQGTAQTRDALLAFKSRLESRVPGTKVELPISELAKSSDIPFSLRVTEPLP